MENTRSIRKCEGYWFKIDCRSEYVLNKVVLDNGETREMDILKRPELAFYDRKGHALSGNLMRQAWNLLQTEGKSSLNNDTVFNLLL